MYFCPQWRSIRIIKLFFLCLLETELVRSREIPHSFPEQRVGEPTTHPTRRFCQKLILFFKYNKSLKDPVRGAGSAQVQIRSYRNRQSGNLARKVRNAFPMCKALRGIVIRFLEASTVLVFLLQYLVKVASSFLPQDHK